jgi:hypothetical protein
MMQKLMSDSQYNEIMELNIEPFEKVALLNSLGLELIKKKPRNNKALPYWKVCNSCNNTYMVTTRFQAVRSKSCSVACTRKLISVGNSKRKPIEQLKASVDVQCVVCGKTVRRYIKKLSKVNQTMCSHSCNGKMRSLELKKHCHKSRSCWSDASNEAFKQRMKGETNPSWKGGVTYIRKKGNYKGSKYVRCPEQFLPMARKDGYIAEHRLLVATELNRLLDSTEVVHHINSNPLDNRIENLMLFNSNSDHRRYEAGQNITPLWQPTT